VYGLRARLVMHEPFGFMFVKESVHVSELQRYDTRRLYVIVCVCPYIHHCGALMFIGHTPHIYKPRTHAHVPLSIHRLVYTHTRYTDVLCMNTWTPCKDIHMQ
jgi:hypothetical protein